MNGRYILDEHGEPVQCDDLLTWARWHEAARFNHGLHIAETYRGELVDRGEGPEPEVRISTLFLALDFSFGMGEPVLWESMVFWDGHYLDMMQRRYRSRAAAESGHRELVAMVEAALAVRGR